ncbi:hypothetical protein [Rhizobium leucaenae]|uniref:hypothetical protein n=1 Tax=Rhizobium leucaenae TaxID=29450 RepID=UPI0007EE652F|nr:hypothetical protein [Rhizobium leucaenae]
MTWSNDMAAAPKDAKIWAASKCGKVIISSWSKDREAWAGFGTNEQPLCWQPYVIPKHPEAA